MALDGLEARLREKFPERANHSYKGKVSLIRYADDFIITGETKELLESEVKPLVEQFMRERGLELSQEKTVITHIENGFDFLGQNVRKYQGKLLIKPSQDNVQELLATVRKIVKENKQTPAGKLIVQLNPIIRGWALYHRHVASKQTFNFVDHAIFLHPLARGKKEALKPGAAMGERQILSRNRPPTMGVHRRGREQKRGNSDDSSLQRGKDTHPTTPPHPK